MDSMKSCEKPLREQSRDEIIQSNLGLVHSCAHRFKGRGIEYDDLFQAGCMGLIKAADAFDMDRGVRFSTYAVPVILGEIRRLFRDGGTVKVSRTLKELSMRVMRERENFLSVHGREPTVNELSCKMEIPVDNIVEALGAAAPPLSLTDSEEEGGGQIDVPVESPEDRMSELISLKQVLGQLKAEDRQLIVLRYFQGKTQTETAKMLSMTQVQVSRREKKILLGLRQQLC